MHCNGDESENKKLTYRHIHSGTLNELLLSRLLQAIRLQKISTSHFVAMQRRERVMKWRWFSCKCVIDLALVVNVLSTSERERATICDRNPFITLTMRDTMLNRNISHRSHSKWPLSVWMWKSVNSSCWQNASHDEANILNAIAI